MHFFLINAKDRQEYLIHCGYWTHLTVIIFSVIRAYKRQLFPFDAMALSIHFVDINTASISLSATQQTFKQPFPPEIFISGVQDVPELLWDWSVQRSTVCSFHGRVQTEPGQGFHP